MQRRRHATERRYDRPRARPLEYEGIRERYLPEYEFRGRSDHRKSHYSLGGAAMVRAGLQPDLLGEVIWWSSDDLWIFALYALVIYGALQPTVVVNRWPRCVSASPLGMGSRSPMLRADSTPPAHIPRHCKRLTHSTAPSVQHELALTQRNQAAHTCRSAALHAA
jgi:hypothetical protein